MRAVGADEIDWAGIIAADRAGEDAGATEPHLLKLTIDDLVQLDATWSKQDDNHRSTELIDGRIHHTPARYMPRGRMVMDLFAALRSATATLPNAPYVGMRGSIAMPPYDLPLPDIVLTYKPHGDGFIPAGSVPLVIEVADSDSSLDFFLGKKMRCYARMSIPEYWVADVNARVIHQMWSRADAMYAERRGVAFGEKLASATIIDLSIVTDKL